MRSFKNQKWVVLSILLGSVALTGCGNPVVFYSEPGKPADEKSVTLDPSGLPNPDSILGEGPTDDDDDNNGGSGNHCGHHCKTDLYRQRDIVRTHSVDLLFVTDTSGSLHKERPGIVNSIQDFVAQLPPGVDYNIGVMLGHGSHSPLAGRLFAQPGNPRVLKSSELALPEILEKFEENFTNLPQDPLADGGEENMYSLSRALDEDRLAEAREHDFFRRHAALAVVFVTDENDICRPFPQVPDQQGLELPAFVRDCQVDGVRTITEQSVLSKLHDVMGLRPFTLGGIIYTDEATVPAGIENSVGYGIKELVKLSDGVLIDLASQDFSSGLHKIGVLTSIQLRLHIHFRVGFKHGKPVIPKSIRVRVDGQLVPHLYDPETGVVTIAPSDAGHAGSKIRIRYCHRHRPHHHGDGDAEDESDGEDDAGN